MYTKGIPLIDRTYKVRLPSGRVGREYEQMKEYIEFLQEKHRATRQALLNAGKSYRSKDVAWENGFLEALQSILGAINEPERAMQLHKTMHGLATMLRK